MSDGPRVLITGASSGIGAALAVHYAGLHARLVLTARRQAELQSVVDACAAAGGSARLVVLDVTRDGEIERAVAEAMRAWGGLDIAIANAGFAVTGSFHALSLEDYRRQFETNVYGVLRTAAAALPELQRSRGRLAIVGSVAGHVPGPGASAYAMSKAAIRSFAESLRIEQLANGVSVTLLSPGFVDSQIRRVDKLGRLRPEEPDNAPRGLAARADRVAAVMEQAIRRRVGERVITGHGRLIVQLERAVPGLVRLLLAKVYAGRRAATAKPITPPAGGGPAGSA